MFITQILLRQLIRNTIEIENTQILRSPSRIGRPAQFVGITTDLWQVSLNTSIVV